MNKIQKQIEKTKSRLATLRQRKRDEDLRKLRNRKSKPRGKKGRPRISDDLIVEAIKKAENRPLADVALSLGISRRTLYNRGIKRSVLEPKKP